MLLIQAIKKDFSKRVLNNKKGIFGLFKSIFGGGDDSNVEQFKKPEFFEDPNFAETQDFLKKLGADILGGDIPEFFRGIAEPGGKEFEDFLALSNKDISQNILDTAAITGRGRGGGVSSLINESIAENTTKARFADFQRALGGKEFFFNQGRGITEGVRAAGGTNQSQRNQFNLNSSGLELEQLGILDDQDIFVGGGEGSFLSSLIGTGLDIFGGEGSKLPETTEEQNNGKTKTAGKSIEKVFEIAKLASLFAGGGIG